MAGKEIKYNVEARDKMMIWSLENLKSRNP